MKAKKIKTMHNVYDSISRLTDATHLEVQYFLPQAKAWLPNERDPMLVDMDSVAVGLLLIAVDNLLFVPQSKVWKQ